MRHDDRSNRPAIDAGPSSGERGAGGSDLFVPGDDDIELIDQADEEIVPSNSELDLADGGQGNDPAYGGAYEPLEPADAGAPLFSSELAAELAAEEPLFDSSGELIVESSLDRPAEGRVSMPPSMPPGQRASSPRIPPPPAVPAEESPWAAEGDAAIDAAALPSAHSPVIAETKPSVKPPPVVPAEPASAARSWVTIFLVIALVASSVTFLILRFNVGQTPQEAPGAGKPIQVPQSGVTTALPVVTAAPPSEPTTPPADTAPAPAASSAEAAPSGSPSGEPADVAAAPSVSGAVSIPTVMVTTSPADAPTGVAKPPTTSKPGVPTTKPTKKPNRIF